MCIKLQIIKYILCYLSLLLDANMDKWKLVPNALKIWRVRSLKWKKSICYIYIFLPPLQFENQLCHLTHLMRYRGCKSWTWKPVFWMIMSHCRFLQRGVTWSERCFRKFILEIVYRWLKQGEHGGWELDRSYCSHLGEKAMATHSSTLAWKIPWMEEPGGLPSVGSHRVEHGWSDLAAAAAGEKQYLLPEPGKWQWEERKRKCWKQKL